MVVARTPEPVVVAALYRFAAFDRSAEFRQPLARLCCGLGVRGTLLLAPEGINGTIAGSRAAIDAVLTFLREQPEFTSLEHKESVADAMPFHRMKVRLKKEIVTMGVPGVDPLGAAGTYVEPENWNALIADPDTVVIDTRNAYEAAIGTFRRAIDPGTETFRDFPAWARQQVDALKGRKVAMFCTGGIRCEKATALMRSLGLDHVYHLRGGILKYLERVDPAESLWEGECFVFDERVAVGHGLALGDTSLCRACRHPLTARDRQSALYEEGVSCAHCHDGRTEEDRARYRERERQVRLNAAKGRTHIGTGAG